MQDSPVASIDLSPVPTMTDRVFDTLYHAVVALDLPPGTRLSEADTARHMNVSRQPVRDAFFRLSQLGFLSIRPQRPTLVTPIQPQAVMDAVFIRCAIEAECLRMAVLHADDAALALLHGNLREQAAVCDDADRGPFHRLDEAFHRLLCEIAGHPHAWTLIQEQKAHMDRIRFMTLSLARRRAVLAEHRAVVEAIAARDVERGEALLRAHLGAIGATLAQARIDHPKFFVEDTQ
ncbi:MAG: GntR family transcriptional regulator [Roseivivax sp.]|nr:GntR family transcriptional regulator [Roseivivax sp.]